LLARTEGLQLTSPLPDVRSRTADYLAELGDCCRDLGGDLMVLGSPAQRRIPSGKTVGQATDYAVATLERALPRLASAGVRLCLEPLSPPEADFINTCAEGLAIVRRISHPNLLLHLDVKAMSTDEAPTPELIRRYATAAGHFHANDANRRGPGFGSTDFVPILQALRDTQYNGWVSVEVFDYTPDPETIARESIQYMRACEAQIS
jgi:sugar phosphate isomerase/epimerase